MRILRGQSSSEVSSQGFALFVVGIIISTFLGGAVRTFLNSNAIQMRLMNEAQKRWPDVSIEIGKMQGVLARGMWPGFVLNFENLHIVRRSCRGESLQIDVERMSAPLRLWSLWRGQARLRKIEASGVKARVFRQDCAKEEPAEKPLAGKAGAASATDKPIAPETKSSFGRFSLDWTPLSKAMDGFVIHDLEFSSEAEPSLKTVVHKLDVETGRELTVNGEVELQKSLPFGPSSHVMNLQISAADGVADFTVAGKFREGELEWRARVDLQRQNFEQGLKVHQIPVRDVLAELYKFGVLEHEMAIKSLWLSCELTQAGVLNDWRASPMVIHDCKVDGGQGKVEVHEAEASLRGGPWLEKPWKLQVTDFQLAPLLEAFRRDPLPKVFAKLGAWTGEIIVETPDQWALNGDLRGVEIIFSSQSVRGKQIVNSVHTELRRDPAGVSGRLAEVKLGEGVIDGEVTFKLDPQVKSGQIDLKFKELLLNPAIQKILLGGTMKTLQVQGLGRLHQGNLEYWSGDLKSTELSGAGWKLDSAAAKSTFRNGTFHLETTGKQFVADESWNQFANVSSIYRREGIKGFTWRDLSAVIEVTGKGGELVRFSANDPSSRMHVSAKAKWQRDHDLVGSMNVSSDQGRRIFTLLGRQNQLSIHAE